MEWTYAPADFFEERVELLVDRCLFVIDAGTVTGHVPLEGDPETIRSFCEGLHNKVEALFLTAQMLAHIVLPAV